MSDEVDHLLRRAMAVLDHQVPEGTFDTLAARTLARLDDPALGEPLGASSGARSNRRPIVAIAGLGLAAAAGAMIFVSVRDQAAGPERAEQARERADAVVRNASPAGTVAASNPPVGAQPPARPSETVASGSAAAVSEPVAIAADAGSTAQGDPGDPITKIAPATKGPAKPVSSYEPKKSKGGKRADAPPQKLGKAMLDKQSLPYDDIQRGMRAVAPKVQACFAGTRGLATVQLTVAPSGQVQKVTVSGPFAGTPVASCVERAAAAATFPAWDGEPQSFGHDYLLSD